jgi:hypothetical protein
MTVGNQAFRSLQQVARRKICDPTADCLDTYGQAGPEAGSGDAIADFEILLRGNAGVSLIAGDFVL